MRLLILGGTVFLGRHLVDAALARGHDVTLFNRGRHNPELYAHLKQLRGDREAGDLAVLAGGHWDAAIDTCGYVPRAVRQSASLLADSVAHYTFVSSISVYSDFTQVGIDEQSPVGTLADPETETVDGESYGPLKVLCERAAEEAMPGRVLTIRPGLIVGPHDPTDRFTYWPVRVALGGTVLAPGRPDRAIQLIDVRDLAGWTVRAVEARLVGVFNADGPDGALTMAGLLDTCRREGGDAAFRWVDDDALLAAGAAPWSEVPLWIPERVSPGFFSVSCRKAFDAGLACRPLAETVRDTLAWRAARASADAPAAGMTLEREAALLASVDRAGAT